MSYHELSATERVTIQIGLCNGCLLYTSRCV